MKLKVQVVDNHTLKLLEDGKAGDIIDISEVSEFDSQILLKVIQEGTDLVYNKKLNEALVEASNKANTEKELAVKEAITKIEKENTSLSEELKNLKDKYQHDLESLVKTNKLETESLIQNNQIENDKKYSELKSLKDNEIINLKNQIESLKNSKDQEISLAKSRLELEYNNKINSLNNTILDKDRELEREKNEFKFKVNEELNKQKEDYEQKLLEKEKIIAEIKRSRAQLNVKNIGEDLEQWCNAEVLTYMQNGLKNCTWEKDNKVLKDEGDTKGNKADFIFKIYSDVTHEEDKLLSGVVLEMKNENPNSINTHKNHDFFKQLDKNRNLKKLKYAILVSDLDRDNPNELPIYKVLEYPDMYVVRPEYMMVLLNMIVSLSDRFADLITAKVAEDIMFKSKLELAEEFDNIKNTYLDKPLESLSKQIESIRSESDKLKDSARKIDDACDKITRTYILEIENKIQRFELKLNKIEKKID